MVRVSTVLMASMVNLSVHVLGQTSGPVPLAGCIGPRSILELTKTLYDNAAYDKHARPNQAAALQANATSPSANPDDVMVLLRWDAIDAVDEKTGNVDVHVSLKVRWKDERLSFRGAAAGGCLGDKIELPGPPPVWKPDLYYMNLVKEKQIVGEYFRFYQDGEVQLQKRQRITISCPMDYTEMPYDVNHCRTRISTFAGKDTDVQLKFYKSGIEGPYKGRSLGGSVEWKLVSWRAEVFDYKAVGDDDTALDFVISFHRDAKYYEQFILTPAILVVILSYSTLYIARSAAPARAGASIVCFLTITNMITGVRASLPKTVGSNGIKLLEMLTTSMCFCVYSMIDFAFGGWLSKTQKRVEAMDSTERRTLRPCGLCTGLLIDAEGKIRLKVRQLDMFSRCLYLPAYAIVLLTQKFK